jgi:hypothetical protein
MANAVLATAPCTASAPYDGFDKMLVNGTWAIEEFTTDHLITVQHVPCPYPF